MELLLLVLMMWCKLLRRRREMSDSLAILVKSLVVEQMCQLSCRLYHASWWTVVIVVEAANSIFSALSPTRSRQPVKSMRWHWFGAHHHHHHHHHQADVPRCRGQNHWGRWPGRIWCYFGDMAVSGWFVQVGGVYFPRVDKALWFQVQEKTGTKRKEPEPEEDVPMSESEWCLAFWIPTHGWACKKINLTGLWNMKVCPEEKAGLECGNWQKNLVDSLMRQRMKGHMYVLRLRPYVSCWTKGPLAGRRRAPRLAGAIAKADACQFIACLACFLKCVKFRSILILGHPGTSWDILGHPGTWSGFVWKLDTTQFQQVAALTIFSKLVNLWHLRWTRFWRNQYPGQRFQSELLARLAPMTLDTVFKWIKEAVEAQSSDVQWAITIETDEKLHILKIPLPYCLGVLGVLLLKLPPIEFHDSNDSDELLWTDLWAENFDVRTRMQLCPVKLGEINDGCQNLAICVLSVFLGILCGILEILQDMVYLRMWSERVWLNFSAGFRKGNLFQRLPCC